MNFSEQSDSFLLMAFREFYREVIRMKRMIENGIWVAPAGTSPVDDAFFRSGLPAQNPLRENAIEGIAINDPVFGTRVVVPPTLDDPFLNTPEHGGNGAPPLPLVDSHGAAIPPSQVGFTPESRRIVTDVQQRLMALFEQQAQLAWRYGGTNGMELYKQVQYVMAAFADEIFLNLRAGAKDWEGKQAWMSNLLESKMFRTHVAGEKFYTNLEMILREADPAYKNLAAVYLLALSLGFRGKFRGEDDQRLIARYREQLFAFIYRRQPDLESESRGLFPEAYQHTLREEIRLRLPNPRVWLGVLALVIVGYVLTTHGLWMGLTSRLDQVNEQIVEIIGGLNSRR